jgi:hypothetical protein
MPFHQKANSIMPMGSAGHRSATDSLSGDLRAAPNGRGGTRHCPPSIGVGRGSSRGSLRTPRRIPRLATSWRWRLHIPRGFSLPAPDGKARRKAMGVPRRGTLRARTDPCRIQQPIAPARH